MQITTPQDWLRKLLLQAWTRKFVPGFGKDKFTGTHKLVWLYNSSEIGLEDVTTCEVFDFSTNAWRSITPSSPYRIVGHFPSPVCVDGSLYWFTECEETKVLSFDLHTETFQVIAKAPFVNYNHLEILLCNLEDRLCVSEKKWPNQVIWSFNAGNRTWDKLYTIDLDQTFLKFGFSTLCALMTLAHSWDVDKKKKKLVFYSREENEKLVIHDPETKSYDVAFSDKFSGFADCYFPSLISIP